MSTTIAVESTTAKEEPEYVYFHYDGRYGHKREVLKGEKMKSTFTEIPLVDIAGIYSDKFEDRLKVAQELAKACEQCGFLYIKNHGVEPEYTQGIFKTAVDYFDQPLENKMEQWIYNQKDLKGYEPVHGARMDDTKTKGDRKESFLIGYDPETDPTTPTLTPEERAMIGENAFPPDQPEFRQKITAYHNRLMTLARRLTRTVALALGAEETALDSAVTCPKTALKIIHYPPQDPSSLDETGIGAHTDFSAITILNQDSVGGLEVLNANAHWIPAPPIEGTFVVNIGDFFMRLSNNRFLSTVHRVTNSTGRERYSVPFFWTMNMSSSIGPLPSCISETNPPQYEAITVEDYYRFRRNLQREKFQATGIGQ